MVQELRLDERREDFLAQAIPGHSSDLLITGVCKYYLRLLVQLEVAVSTISSFDRDEAWVQTFFDRMSKRLASTIYTRIPIRCFRFQDYMIFFFLRGARKQQEQIWSGKTIIFEKPEDDDVVDLAAFPMIECAIHACFCTMQRSCNPSRGRLRFMKFYPMTVLLMSKNSSAGLEILMIISCVASWTRPRVCSRTHFQICQAFHGLPLHTTLLQALLTTTAGVGNMATRFRVPVVDSKDSKGLSGGWTPFLPGLRSYLHLERQHTFAILCRSGCATTIALVEGPIPFAAKQFNLLFFP